VRVEKSTHHTTPCNNAPNDPLRSPPPPLLPPTLHPFTPPSTPRPFVMNTQEEIMQAFKDHQAGKLQNPDDDVWAAA